jgi:signal transduction histidine kinase
LAVLPFESRRRAKSVDEHLRLARELHDGVLQSLAAATLQLDVVSRLIDNDPAEARARVRQVEAFMLEQQRELRAWVDAIRVPDVARPVPAAELSESLDRLCRRAEWQWRLRITRSLPAHGDVPRRLADELYRMVQEALCNAGKHARANAVRLGVRLGTEAVSLEVEDDGLGFAFHGELDLTELARRGVGPLSIRQRVTALAGKLTVASSWSGARLTIELPLATS